MNAVERIEQANCDFIHGRIALGEYEERLEPFRNVLPIPNNASNGDVIKDIFPECVLRVVTETQVGISFIDNQSEITWIPSSWWYAPYKENSDADSN